MSAFSWADEEDDDGLREALEIQSANPWLALDPTAALPTSRNSTQNKTADKRRQPFYPFLEIPPPIKTSCFWVILAKPNQVTRGAAGEKYIIVNKGPCGSKNCHTTITIDGGQTGCPCIRIAMTLSEDPAQMVNMGISSNIQLEVQLPCGPVQMASALFQYYRADQFNFASALHPQQENSLSTEAFEILKRGKETREDVLKRSHGCAWKIGGGVVLDGFDHAIVQRIRAEPNLYHSEAASNLAAIEQLATVGGTASLTFVLGNRKPEKMSEAHEVLECFQHSVRNDHLFYYQ
jgi:hypothetical protein